MALVTHLLIVNSHNHVTFRLLGLLILFAVSFSVHNKQVMAESPNLCKFSKYSNENQNALDYALKRLSPLLGKTYTSLDGTDWQYQIGICANVGSDLKQDTAVLQSELKDGKATDKVFKIGALSESHIIVGTDWIMLEYRNGDPYPNHCGKELRRAMVMLSCDPNIDDGSAQMVFMKEEKSKTEQCYYLFEMKHQAICPLVAQTSSLSVGTILIVIFFSVVAVYLLVGFLYSRFVLRAKGVEQIPNYEFWKDFGNLQADGCEFVCRSKGRRRGNNFGGIGDDQLESAEEIHDDHLLPM